MGKKKNIFFSRVLFNILFLCVASFSLLFVSIFHATQQAQRWTQMNITCCGQALREWRTNTLRYVRTWSAGPDRFLHTLHNGVKKKKKKKYECRKINIYFSGSCICVWLLSNLTKSRLSAIILPITHNLFTHTSSCIKHNTSKYWSIVNNPTIVWWMNFWLHVNFILNPHRW